MASTIVITKGVVVQPVRENAAQMQGQMAQLKEILSDQEAQIAAFSENSLASEAQESRPRKLRSGLTLIRECIPEIQSQINTLEIEYGFAFPDDAPSAQCEQLFYPNLSDGVGD